MLKMHVPFHGRAIVVTAIVVLGTVLIGVEPAQAGSKTLCSGFRQCKSKKLSDASYSKAQRKAHWNMAPGINCTNYVAYRLTHKRKTARPVGLGRASTWGAVAKKAGVPVTSKPRVGAVAWWKSGVYPAKKKGHVAYVEKVYVNGSILISEDNMNKKFTWRKVTRGKGWPSGFIHFPKSNGTPQGELLSATAAAGKVRVRLAASDPDKFGALMRYDVKLNDATTGEFVEGFSISSRYFETSWTKTVRTRGDVTVEVVARNLPGTPGTSAVLGELGVSID